MNAKTAISTSRTLVAKSMRRAYRIKESVSGMLVRRRGREIIPSLAKGVDWDRSPEFFKDAHRRATERVLGETDLRQVATRLSGSRKRVRSLWHAVTDLLMELNPSLKAFGIDDENSLVLELDNGGRIWAITRDCPPDAVINAGFGALANGVSVLFDLSRCKPVGAAMLIDAIQPLPSGKRIEIRITCRKDIPFDDEP